MPPPVLDESDGAVGDGGGQRCSCLPFCFWGASLVPKNKSAGAPAKRRRRRCRFRLRLSWLAWPWFSSRKGGKKKGAGGDDGESKGRKRRGRRLLLLLTTSLQPKKALESVVSGDSALLPAKVGSLGDAKKRSNRKPRRTADDGPSGSRQPQALTTASTTTRWSTAPARPGTEASHPSPTPSSAAAAAGRIWRAPSRRRHSFQYQADSTGRPGGDGVGGLWTAATTLGAVVLFGRVTAVVFLCSCLYGARFVRAWMGGAGAKSSGVAGGSRRFGDPVGVAVEKAVVAEQCATEECKKKVVMAGLLDRAGKMPPSSRFGR